MALRTKDWARRQTVNNMDQDTPLSLPAFGLRLRRQRRATGVKQFALSDALQVDQSSVSRWEAGVQVPDAQMQKRAFDLLVGEQRDDFALRRLVETSSSTIHLIEDATHKCLAFSKKRGMEWGNIDHSSLYQKSLWRFATKEIQAAEENLAHSDWWSAQHPAPHSFITSAKVYHEIIIRPGQILWERMYLADGTPVRLCTNLDCDRAQSTSAQMN